MVDDMPPDEARALIPEDFQRLGFTGLFNCWAVLSVETDEEVEQFAAKLPTWMPFGTNSGWLGVTVDRETKRVLLCRKDENAIMDIVYGRLRG